MHPETNQPDYNLVSRYLAGEASPEEAMLIHEWISDPENKKSFDQMLKAWNMIPGASTMQTPDAADSWLNIQNAITVPRNRKPVFRKMMAYGIAAAITGIAVLIVSNRTNNRKQTDAYIFRSATTEVVKHRMTDGSLIFINRNSKVAFTRLYNQENRKVRLEGEAFFNVTPGGSKPFIIETGGVEIKVTGTAFNVRTVYEKNQIEVQVEEGTVEMYASQHRIIINKGQTGIFDKQRSSLVLKDGLDINSLGYATKSFSFNDISLKEAARYLENAFDVSIEMDDAKFNDCRITAAFQDKSLTYILEVINATLNTSSRKAGNTIVIEGEGCR